MVLEAPGEIILMIGTGMDMAVLPTKANTTRLKAAATSMPNENGADFGANACVNKGKGRDGEGGRMFCGERT